MVAQLCTLTEAGPRSTGFREALASGEDAGDVGDLNGVASGPCEALGDLGEPDRVPHDDHVRQHPTAPSPCS